MTCTFLCIFVGSPTFLKGFGSSQLSLHFWCIMSSDYLSQWSDSTTAEAIFLLRQFDEDIEVPCSFFEEPASPSLSYQEFLGDFSEGSEAVGVDCDAVSETQYSLAVASSYRCPPKVVF